MLVPMTKVRILGPRSAAERRTGRTAPARARRARGCAHRAFAERAGRCGDPFGPQRGTRLVLAQTEKLLGEVPDEPISAGAVQPLRRPLDLPELRKELDEPRRRRRGGRPATGCAARRAVRSPTYLEPLRSLLAARAGSRRLDAEKLRLIGLATVAVVLNTDDERLVETLRVELAEELGTRFELASTRIEQGAMGCLVVFPVDSVGLRAGDPRRLGAA